MRDLSFQSIGEIYTWNNNFTRESRQGMYYTTACPDIASILRMYKKPFTDSQI